jgi:hypothetical protein
MRERGPICIVYDKLKPVWTLGNSLFVMKANKNGFWNLKANIFRVDGLNKVNWHVGMGKEKREKRKEKREKRKEKR